MRLLDQPVDPRRQRLVIDGGVLAQHIGHQRHDVVQAGVAGRGFHDRQGVHVVLLVAVVLLALEAFLGLAGVERAGLEVDGGLAQGR